MAIEKHMPVMEREVITGLNIKVDGIYIDATFGRGGHTIAILNKLAATGRVIVVDKDPEAIASAKQLQKSDPRVSVYHGSYARLREFCIQEQVIGKVAGIVLDLGVSSPQLDQASRGFSFLKDGPLDMRMDQTAGVSAAEWLARANVAEITEVLKTYGEERHAKRIANAICQGRQNKPITTTKALADIIMNVYPQQYQLNKHPATRSFQGIRIFINNELADLQQVLTAIIDILAPTGRLVVISFHSLEDRIVKQFINNQIKGDSFPQRLPILAEQLRPTLKKIGKRQQPNFQEIMENIRSRSATLRIAEKLPVE